MAFKPERWGQYNLLRGWWKPLKATDNYNCSRFPHKTLCKRSRPGRRRLTGEDGSRWEPWGMEKKKKVGREHVKETWSTHVTARVCRSLYVTHWHAHTHTHASLRLSWRSPSCYKTVKSSWHLFASPVNHKHNLCLQRPNAARSPAEDARGCAEWKVLRNLFSPSSSRTSLKAFLFDKDLWWGGRIYLKKS